MLNTVTPGPVVRPLSGVVEPIRPERVCTPVVSRVRESKVFNASSTVAAGLNEIAPPPLLASTVSVCKMIAPW